MTDKIKGIGGWLLFPIISLIVATLYGGYSFYIDFIQGDYLFSLVDIIILVIIIYLLNLAFKHDKRFPRYIITFMWIGWLASLIGGVIIEDYSGVVVSFLSTLLWSEYFRSSKRVENTFVK